MADKYPQWKEILTMQLSCLMTSVAASWFIMDNATKHIQRELDHLGSHTYQVHKRAEGLYERLVDPEILSAVPPAPLEDDWGRQEGTR